MPVSIFLHSPLLLFSRVASYTFTVSSFSAMACLRPLSNPNPQLLFILSFPRCMFPDDDHVCPSLVHRPLPSACSQNQRESLHQNFFSSLIAVTNNTYSIETHTPNHDRPSGPFRLPSHPYFLSPRVVTYLMNPFTHHRHCGGGRRRRHPHHHHHRPTVPFLDDDVSSFFLALTIVVDAVAFIIVIE